MISTGVTHTLLFVLLNLVMLFLLAGCRPAKQGLISPTRLVICACLAPVALGLLFLAGEGGAHDKSVTIKIDQFRVPFESVAPRRSSNHEENVYFVAGEKPEHSDLVVKPYADQVRAAEFVRDDPRPILEAIAEKEGETVRISLCRYNHPASADLELPGWEVRYTVNGEELPSAGAVRDCSYELNDTGEAVDVALFRVDQIDGKPAPKERRSFTVSRADNALIVRLHTPVSIDARECRSERFRLLPGIPLAQTINFLPPKSIRPPQIGTGGANPVLDPQYIGNTMGAGQICGGETERYLWPSVAGESWHVSGSVTRNFIPWFLVILFAANSMVLLALRSNWWRAERVEASVVFLLQWMLMLRAMIGTAGLYANPNLARANVLLDAGMAYVCLPAIAVLLLMKRSATTKQTATIFAGMSIASYTALLISLDTGLNSIVPLAYLLIVLAIAAWRAFAKFEESILSRTLTWLTKLEDDKALFRTGVFVILIALVPRIGLMVTGWILNSISKALPALSERVGPIPLSTLYQPLLIIGFAALLIATVKRPSWRRALVILSLWGFTGAIMPAFLGDFGILWIYSWPLAIVISWYTINTIITVKPVSGAILAPLALSPLAIFALAFFLSSQPIAEASGNALGEHLETAVDWNSRDQVRLMRFAAPEKLELLGNRMSFDMLDQAASLEPLVRDFWGQGYLKPSLIKDPIRKYQFNDNLLPVHIAWPFGRLGLIAMLCSIAGSAALLLPRVPLRIASVSTAISCMAATTIAWAAIYMALANLNLVPFTGRNVFLLAVTSGGDAIEGLILVLLAASAAVVGATRKGSEETEV